MKVILINGSPRREKSISLMISKAFLEGMGVEYKQINLYDKKIEPCLADFSCWFKTPHKCVRQDDVEEIYQEIRMSDLTIWSMPLYVFNFPSEVKKLYDRIIQYLEPAITFDEKGRTTHPGIGEIGKQHLLVMTAAFPDVEGNFDGVKFQFQRMFGEASQMITCPESSLFVYKKSERISKLTATYLEEVKKAGSAYMQKGYIPQENMQYLNSRMMPREEYIEFTNSR